MERPTREQYFIELAEAASKRSTCDRARVGCVLVTGDHHVIATGYNGSLPGEHHCDEVGHLMEDGHCVRTIHAEINALASCAKKGIATKDCTLYTTHSPCTRCYLALKRAGITKFVAKQMYGPIRYDVKLAFSQPTQEMLPKFPPLPPCRHCGTTDLCECQDQ